LGRRYERRKRQSEFYKDATFYSTDVQEVKEGYGEGGSVVVRAHAP